MRRGFVERSVDSLRSIAERALVAESAARRDGALQRLDARVKVVAMLSLVAVVVSVHDRRIIATVLVIALGASVLAGREAVRVLARTFIVATAIATIATVPALVLTPGEPLIALPFGIEVTRQGAQSVALLLARVATATTLSLLVVLTTRWATLLRALRLMHVPAVVVTIVGMTYRYLFVVLEMAGELFDARRSRRVGAASGREERRLAGATAGALMTRTLRLSEDVFLAMQARGFRGEVRVLEDPRMRAGDWLTTVAIMAIAAGLIVAGR